MTSDDQPRPAPGGSSSRCGPLFGRASTAGQIEGRIDQGDMRKRLWKIPDLTPGAWVVFLRQQAEIVGEPQQPFEKAARLGGSVLQNVIVGKPEAAGQKRPFPGR